MFARCLLTWGLMLMPVIGCSCSQAGSDAAQAQAGNDLSSMAVTQVAINERPFEVWLATSSDQRQKGLMFVESDQMQDLEDGTPRGMLFVFPFEQHLGFWMRNTIIPLDIAYARTDGTIVRIHTMTPLDESIYASGEPARFALEVNAGLFASMGIQEGDVIDIPDSVLNGE